MTHILFCLRHFNDIDNVVPAIHFTLERRHVVVTVLIYSVDYDFREDVSLRFLQETWGERVRVVWIGELAGFPRAAIGVPLGSKLLARPKRSVRRFNKAMVTWLRPLFAEWGTPQRVVFDQNRTGEISGLLATLRERGVKHISSLPVSPWMNFNVLRQTDFINLRDRNFSTKHDYSGFDAIGQVDGFYASQLEKVFGLLGLTSPFRGCDEVLGSIRYTPEWLAIRDGYVSRARQTKIRSSSAPNGKKVLIIPSHRKNNSFWDEYLRTLAFLGQFENYQFAVKPHTRYGDGYENLPKNIDAYPGVDTSQLIDWADIILFWSSSAAIEGFQKGRTMIRLEYLNGNRSTYEELGAGYACHSRDDLLEVLLSPDAMARAESDSASGAEILRQQIIEGGKGPDVVDRVVRFCVGD